MKNVFALLFLTISGMCLSQAHILSGHIYSQQSGGLLSDVNVVVANDYGTTADSTGFYKLELSEGTYTLKFTHIGFQSLSKSIEITNGPQELNIYLLPSRSQLDEVEIIAQQRILKKNFESNSVSLKMPEVNHIPTLLGETDVVRVIQLLPGVQSGTEGTTGFHVRGGSPDQNLILLDGIPIYNASHLFGFFSTFNGDVIDDMKLTKGAFPARYGGRLSSILEIGLKEGSLNEYKGSVTASLIAPKLMLEGPLVRDKTSFIISGRRTIYDLVVAALYPKNDRVNYYFGDFNTKIKHILGPKDKLFLSYFYSGDKFSYQYDDDQGYSSKSGLKWRTHLTSLNWQHRYSKNLKTEIIGSWTNYKLNTVAEDNNHGTIFELDYQSLIEDIALRYDMTYNYLEKHEFKTGVRYTYHTFRPGTIQTYHSDGSTATTDEQNLSTPIFSHDVFAYAEDRWQFTNRLAINAGLHYGIYQVEDTSYHALQPRLSVQYSIFDDWIATASYSKMTQFLHLLSNSGSGMPTDLWVSATQNISPQNSEQWALSSTKYFNQRNWQFTTELYYKTMRNLIEYKEGASYISQADWQTMVESDGAGQAYGLEVLLKKNEGNTTGWISYTLAKTERTFSNLNDGKTFPYRYDRRHNLAIVLNHKFNQRINVSATWVYQSGIAFTGPVSKYEIPQNGLGDFYPSFEPIEHLSDRNELRYPAYHRLDVGINFIKKKKRGERIWNVSIYNAYNRINPFFIDLKENQAGKVEVIQVGLFPVIPSVSYRFTF